MDRILIWGVLLLYSFESQGLQHVFVRHGKDLQLDVKEPVVLEKKADLFWKFNMTNSVGKISYNREVVLYDSYEGRAELFGQNYSLLLKNVRHSDSGDYTSIVVGGQDRTVAEYKVTVQDPVSPPYLTVTSISSDSCNITVTCSTVGSSFSSTFRCDAKHCFQAEEQKNATNYRSSLTVYLHDGFITCNHSNEVSWELSNKTKHHCETESASSGVTIIAALASVALVALVALIVICIVRKGKRGNRENVPCEAPQDVPPGQTQNVLGTASGPSPTSTYALVEFHRGPEFTKNKNTQPETVYAQVNTAAKPKSTAQRPTPRAREQAAESIYRKQNR